MAIALVGAVLTAYADAIDWCSFNCLRDGTSGLLIVINELCLFPAWDPEFQVWSLQPAALTAAGLRHIAAAPAPAAAPT
jgi:hypothetical protein